MKKLIITALIVALFPLSAGAWFMMFDDIPTYSEDATVTAEFSPSDISGLRLWLKADSLSLSNGDPVSTWTDMSGNGLDATASGSNRATYTTNWSNSKPALFFDGVDDYYAVSSFYDTNWTQFAVFEKNATYSDEFPTITSNSSNSGRYGVFVYSTDTYISHGGADAYASGQDGTGKHYWTGRTNGTTLELWKDGSSLTLTPGANPGGTGSFYNIGRREADNVYAGGYMAEMIFYDSVLSDANRGLVETYLKNKYGL